MKITSISEISEKEEFNENDRSLREFNIKSHFIKHAYTKDIGSVDHFYDFWIQKLHHFYFIYPEI